MPDQPKVSAVKLGKRTDVPLPEQGVNVAQLSTRESLEIPKGHMDLAQVDRRGDDFPLGEAPGADVVNKVL